MANMRTTYNATAMATAIPLQPTQITPRQAVCIMINGTLRSLSTQKGSLSPMDLLVVHAPGQRVMATWRPDSLFIMPFCAAGGHADSDSDANNAEFCGARFLTAHSSLM